MAVEIGAKAEANTLIAGTELSIAVTRSISNSWTQTWNEENSIESTCTVDDDGKPLKSGCMWQFNMKTSRNMGKDTVSWNPSILKCTKGLE